MTDDPRVFYLLAFAFVASALGAALTEGARALFRKLRRPDRSEPDVWTLITDVRAQLRRARDALAEEKALGFSWEADLKACTDRIGWLEEQRHWLEGKLRDHKEELAEMHRSERVATANSGRLRKALGLAAVADVDHALVEIARLKESARRNDKFAHDNARNNAGIRARLGLGPEAPETAVTARIERLLERARECNRLAVRAVQGTSRDAKTRCATFAEVHNRWTHNDESGASFEHWLETNASNHPAAVERRERERLSEIRMIRAEAFAEARDYFDQNSPAKHSALRNHLAQKAVYPGNRPSPQPTGDET